MRIGTGLIRKLLTSGFSIVLVLLNYIYNVANMNRWYENKG